MIRAFAPAGFLKAARRANASLFQRGVGGERKKRVFIVIQGVFSAFCS
jgi:hypothetical protein